MTTDKVDHGYIWPYQMLLAGRDTRRILEIGVYQGDSLRLWAEWFPDAEIHGIDLEPVEVEVGQVHHGDAYTPEMLDLMAYYAPFDLIVDDGSHRLANMQFVLVNYINFLRPGGLLVIEDMRAKAVVELASIVPFQHRHGVLCIDRSMLRNRNSRMFVVETEGGEHG